MTTALPTTRGGRGSNIAVPQQPGDRLQCTGWRAGHHADRHDTDIRSLAGRLGLQQRHHLGSNGGAVLGGVSLPFLILDTPKVASVVSPVDVIE